MKCREQKSRVYIRIACLNAANIDSYGILNEKLHVKHSMRFRLLPQHTVLSFGFFFRSGLLDRSRKKQHPENYFMRMNFVWMWIRPQTVINVEQRTARKCRQLKPIRKNHCNCNTKRCRSLCARVCLFFSHQVARTQPNTYWEKNATFFYIQYRVIRHNFKAFFHFVNSMPHNISLHFAGWCFFFLPQLYKLFILQIWKCFLSSSRRRIQSITRAQCAQNRI